jgi:hypothetical protein
VRGEFENVWYDVSFVLIAVVVLDEEEADMSYIASIVRK